MTKQIHNHPAHTITWKYIQDQFDEANRLLQEKLEYEEELREDKEKYPNIPSDLFFF